MSAQGDALALPVRRLHSYPTAKGTIFHAGLTESEPDKRELKSNAARLMRSAMHNVTKKDKGLGVARGLADSGEHGSWRSVETRMQKLGHYEADLWFADLLFRNEIEAICVRTRRA